MTGDYTIVGRIRKPHGLQGELLVEMMCADPAAIFAAGSRVIAGDAGGDLLGGAVRALSVSRSRPFKGELLVTFKEISDRNEAEVWRHRCVLIPTSELRPPEAGEVWVHELVGMSVSDVRGAHVGEVIGVEEVPQGLLLDVKTSRGTSSVPFVDAIVVAVDRDERKLTIDPPEGLLDL